MGGGQPGNAFSKSVTYRPTLSKFKGGPVKKNTLHIGPKKDTQIWDLAYGIAQNWLKMIQVPKTLYEVKLFDQLLSTFH